MLTDDNADCADLDKSNAQVINGQFLSVYKPGKGQEDRMKDYTRRYIRNKQGMEIQWTPEYVRISANGASMAEINKSGTVSLMTGNKIAMQDRIFPFTLAAMPGLTAVMNMRMHIIQACSCALLSDRELRQQHT